MFPSLSTMPFTGRTLWIVVACRKAKYAKEVESLACRSILLTRSVIQHQLPFWRALRDRICPLAHFICPLAPGVRWSCRCHERFLNSVLGPLRRLFLIGASHCRGRLLTINGGVAVPAGGKIFPPRFICQSNNVCHCCC